MDAINDSKHDAIGPVTDINPQEIAEQLADPDLGTKMGPVEESNGSGNTLPFSFIGNHQIYVRSIGFGGAPPLFFQAAPIYLFNGPPPPGPGVHGSVVTQLGGKFIPQQSAWIQLERKLTQHTYYPQGLHYEGGIFKSDQGIGWLRQRYSKGILYTIGFNDTDDDYDYNDFIIELACHWG